MTSDTFLRRDRDVVNIFCRISRLFVSFVCLIYAATISLLSSNEGNGLHGVWRVLVVGWTSIRD
jgi:hypothetical protein